MISFLKDVAIVRNLNVNVGSCGNGRLIVFTSWVGSGRVVVLRSPITAMKGL